MNSAGNARSAEKAPAPVNGTDARDRVFSWKQSIALAAGAVVAFHLAYGFPRLSWLMIVYLGCLYRLAALPTPRRAFYFGLVIGYAVYAPHLTFFWTIFGWPAVALWTVLPFWLGLFVALARLCRKRLGSLAPLLIPFIWTGLEYFRSELYYLRFSWLNVGYAFAAAPQVFVISHLGAYGIAMALMVVIATLSLFPRKSARVAFTFSLVALACFTN